MYQKTPCKKCAECCKNFPFIKLSQTEANLMEDYSKLHIDQFAEKIEKKEKNYFLRFDEDGDCYFLEYKNGIYFCKIYEIRPSICKIYPGTTIQKQYCTNSKRKYSAPTAGSNNHFWILRLLKNEAFIQHGIRGKSESDVYFSDPGKNSTTQTCMFEMQTAADCLIWQGKWVC